MRVSTFIAISSFVLSLSLLLSGCGKFEQRLPEAGYRLLTSNEIRTALAGNTVYGTFYGASGHDTGAAFFAADGQARSRSNQGKWKVTDDNLFCDQWSNFEEGSDCDRVYLRGTDIVFVNLGGNISSEGKIEQGNSRGL